MAESVVLPITNNINAASVGKGTVSFERVGDYNNFDSYPSNPDQQSQQRAYRFTAVPDANWRFDHFQIQMQVWNGSQTKTFNIQYSDSNVWGSHWFDYSPAQTEYYWKDPTFTEWTDDNRFFVNTSGGSLSYQPWDTVPGYAFRTIYLTVTGVFVSEVPPERHGLIYSPTRGGKLIYDTETGRLMYYP